jgi:hypothetical protein
LGVVSQLIGIGIELTDPVFPKLLAHRVATLSELRPHGHKTIEQCHLLIVVTPAQTIAIEAGEEIMQQFLEMASQMGYGYVHSTQDISR